MIARPHLTVGLAVDLVVLTVRDTRLEVLLIERGVEPFRGRLALPGGFLREGEDLLDAAVRELAEETGIRGIDPCLEQVRTYAAPDRDPRGRIATVAHLAILPDLPAPTAGTDAAGARWEPVRAGSPGLAFDHDTILVDAVEQARRRLENTPLAAQFCRPEFTIAELRAVYEAVWGVALDPRNFHRKVTGLPGFVVPTGEMRSPHTGRPAAVYRRGPATALNPPLQRPA
ncbi:NUDIX hydrolase [Actinoplanes sp. NPDC020271]|uniref:NUDIX hydrolase n=1 Tax=Actinoplanes sp. NPDC020271 TaxID=3363896 RepID=UPI00378FE0B0